MADNALLKALATKINAAVDIPALPEVVEQAIFELALETALGFLPPQYIAWLQSAADGIDDTEAAAVSAWLVTLMGKYGSFVPAILHPVVADAVVGLLRKGAAVVLD